MVSWGVQSYFQYYAKLANQQNMLQDGVRTSTYNRAIARQLRKLRPGYLENFVVICYNHNVIDMAVV